MNKLAAVLTLFAVVLASGLTKAEENDSLQEKYFSFWKPHAGAWKITIKEDGKDDLVVIFDYTPSRTGLCYVSHGVSQDGTPMGDGIFGYDPVNKCWLDVMFHKVENSSVFVSAHLRANVEEDLHAGSRVSLDMTESQNGVAKKYTCTRVYETVEKDRIVYVHRNRRTVEGESLPDITLTWGRKK